MRYLSILLLTSYFFHLPPSSKPSTYIWDMKEVDTLAMKPTSQAYKALVKKADDLVGQEPISVTDKSICISGDKHNYESLATYYWPDPNNPQGHYISKDGQTNPETNRYDFPRLLKLNEICTYLGRAFYITRDIKYHAALCNYLDAWFVSKSTRMNPSMEYSQFIPRFNENKGMPGGVLDAYRFVDVIESIMLVDQIKSIGWLRRKKLKKWFGDLAEWIIDSPNGQKASKKLNNHAIAYYGTLLEIALFTNDRLLQQKAIDGFILNVDKQIEKNGKMPQELSRTKAFTYSIFNLSHIIDCYAMAKNSGIEIPDTTKKRIQDAAIYLSSFVGKKESFPYKEIGQWESQEKNLDRVLRRMVQLELRK